MSIDVDPGGGGPLAAPSPQLGWVTVSLINSDGIVQATATNASGGSGSTVTLSDFTFPADGTYTIQVEAPSSQSASTGFYEMRFTMKRPRHSALLGQSEKRHARGAVRHRRVVVFGIGQPGGRAQQDQCTTGGSSLA